MSAAVAKLFTRRLPGHAYRNASGDVVFIKGRLNYDSSRVQWVETDSKIHPLIALIGQTFLYWCRRCRANVFEEECINMGAHKCPFCSGAIERLHAGDKVRLHYRFAHDAAWAAWWAEKWDW